jgi:glycosyltransferase involved in cell wall biosynthesis
MTTRQPQNAPDGIPEVVVVGQTPPPYHGQAAAIQALVASKHPDFRVHHVRMAFSRTSDEISRFRLRKVGHLASVVARTRSALGRLPTPILYYPPASAPLAMLRDAVILRSVRPRAAATVLHFHSGGVAEQLRKRPMWRAFCRKAYAGADVAIQLGPSAPPDGTELGARRVVIVANGLDVPRLPRSRRPDDGTIRALYVGLLSESKGIRRALHVVHALREQGLPVALHAVGPWASPHERETCSRMLAGLNLEDRVVFPGVRTGDDKWREFADADLFLFPSTYENEIMPLAVIEAMAHGLPVVAFRWRALPDLVLDGEGGILVPPGDDEGLAATVAGLVADPRRRLDLGAAALRRYREHFTLSRHLERMSRVFRDVHESIAAP